MKRQRGTSVEDLVQLFNLFEVLDRVGYRDILYLVLNNLEKADLQNVAMIAITADRRDDYKYNRLFNASKTLYIQNTRTERAEALKNHAMNCYYDEAKKLARVDPSVMAVSFQYKINYRAPQNINTMLTLTFPEYAWRSGDENLIAIVEELSEHIPASVYDRKNELSEEAAKFRYDLANELMGQGRNYNSLWFQAPKWIYGLSVYLDDEQISRNQINSIDIFSQKFRLAVKSPGGGILNLEPKAALAAYLMKPKCSDKLSSQKVQEGGFFSYNSCQVM